MNDADVLQLFVDRYAAVPAPAPNRELATRMDAGWIGGDADRGAVVVPLVPRPRVRLRYLVAALVATFVVTSGLAVAGALPAPIQRGVADVVSHLGIDLPSPAGGSVRAPTGGGGDHGTPGGATPGASTPGDSGSGSPRSGSGANGTDKAGTPATTSTSRPGPGGLGSTPTTLPPVTTPPVTVPPTTVPPVTVPPIQVPPIQLPPIGLPPILPPISLPPISLPPISLPPISLPPLLPGL